MRDSGLIRLTILFFLMVGLTTPVLADLQVNVRRDKVVLKDGQEVECIVLMATAKGVLIIEESPDDPESTQQRVIPWSEVKDVICGELDGSVTGFRTETELCHKVIQGEGFRKQASSHSGKNNSEAPSPNDPHTKTAAGKNVGKNTGRPSVNTGATPIAFKYQAKELADIYWMQYPALKAALQTSCGLDGCVQLLDGAKTEPQLRQAMDNIVGRLADSEGSPLTERSKTAQAGGKTQGIKGLRKQYQKAAEQPPSVKPAPEAGAINP